MARFIYNNIMYRKLLFFFVFLIHLKLLMRSSVMFLVFYFYSILNILARPGHDERGYLKGLKCVQEIWK